MSQKNKKPQSENEFKKALEEAADWNLNLTSFERTQISYAEAKKRSVNKIFKKYKNKILKDETFQ